MAPFLAHLVAAQPNRPTVYAEPFAGGAGAALYLLTEGLVERIALNDLNDGVAAFWRSVFTDTDRLVRSISWARLTLNEWHRQREAYLDEQADPFDRGFALSLIHI